jgi:iron complex outermembrane receptor protein
MNTIKGNILTSYSTNNRQRSVFGSLGGNLQGINWNAWGDYKAAADYSNKYDGRVWNSKFNEKNFGGYLGYNGSWGYSHFIYSRFDQRLGVIEGDRNDDGNFIMAVPGGGDTIPTEKDYNSVTPYVPSQRVQHTKYIWDNSIKAGKGTISLNLAMQRNQRQEFGNADDPSEKQLYFDLQTFSYRAAYHFNSHHGWNTSLGINGIAQDNENKGVEALIPDYSFFDFGIYVYTQKTVGKASFSGGMRYDNRNLHADALMDGSDVKSAAFSRNYSNISASAGVSYAATDNLLFKINLARGFRAPSIPELASNGTHEGTNRYEYGEQDLVSETSWQGDLGFELNNEHLLFTVSGFYNDINNFIFYSKLPNALAEIQWFCLMEY